MAQLWNNSDVGASYVEQGNLCHFTIRDWP